MIKASKEPMILCPDLVRQRCVIEFLTDLGMNDFEFIEKHMIKFLKDLSSSLSMKIFMGPIVGNDRNEETGENGPSAMVGWTTSGCQIHCWPFRKFVSVDIYSCKIYSVTKVVDLVNQYFNPTEIVVKEV
jgi:S-adenosylmethionine/arginine decarboxylase-like enzyme